MSEVLEWSSFQKDIFNFVEKSDESLFVEAVAGAGKTTNLVKIASMIPANGAIFLAFNKHIKDELQKKLPNDMAVMTMNALGFRAWKEHAGWGVKVNASKVDDIIDKHIELVDEKKIKTEDKEEMGQLSAESGRLWKLRGLIRKMVSTCKANLAVPKSQVDLGEDLFYLEVLDQWFWDSYFETNDVELEIANLYNIDYNPNDPVAYAKLQESVGRHYRFACEKAEFILFKNNMIQETIDFDDQLYFPLLFKIYMRKYQHILCDEAQDFSRIQLELIKKVSNTRSQVIGVGDRMQAIYQWRGADEKAVDRFIEYFKCNQLPLPITYRCGKKIVEEAQKHNPQIQAWTGTGEGKVDHIGSNYTYKTFTDEDLVICRFNAPILAFMLEMIDSGQRVRYVGKDMKNELAALVRNFNATDIYSFEKLLTQWYEVQSEKLEQKFKQYELVQLRDKYFTLKTICKKVRSNDRPSKLIDMVYDIFSGTSGVRVSSVHRAKGLEAKKVYIIDGDLMPFKNPKKEEATQEEINIAYVGITRAKDELIYMKSRDDFRSAFYSSMMGMNEDEFRRTFDTDIKMNLKHVGAINPENVDKVLDQIANDVKEKHHPGWQEEIDYDDEDRME